MSDKGGDEVAQEIIQEVLEDAEPGDMAGAQTAGEIENPHDEDHHTDSWSGTVEEDGSITIDKEHTPDENEDEDEDDGSWDAAGDDGDDGDGGDDGD